MLPGESQACVDLCMSLPCCRRHTMCRCGALRASLPVKHRNACMYVATQFDLSSSVHAVRFCSFAWAVGRKASRVSQLQIIADRQTQVHVHSLQGLLPRSLWRMRERHWRISAGETSGTRPGASQILRMQRAWLRGRCRREARPKREQSSEREKGGSLKRRAFCNCQRSKL